MKIKDKIKKEKLQNYISLLKKYKQNVNIIGTTDRAELKSIIEDSIITIEGQKKVLDIGTGAGIPGVPIKLSNPKISISFLDKSRKKMNILRHILYSLNVQYDNLFIGKAGKYADTFSSTFDIILSRGMGDFKYVLKKAKPFLKKNGTIYLWKPSNYSTNEINKKKYEIKKITSFKKKECKIVKLDF